MRRPPILLPGLLCLAALAAGAARADEDDRGFLTRLLEDNLSGAGHQVRIDGFQGVLSSTAQIASLTIADEDGIWLRLTDVALDWQRSALFSGQLAVNSLTAAEIILDRLPAGAPDRPSPEAVPFALPELPVAVRIGELRADRIALGPAVLGQPVQARLTGGAELADGQGRMELRLERSDARAGRLAMAGAFDNASRHLRLDLDLSEPAGGIAAGLLGLPGTPALDLTVTGDDGLDDFTARIHLASGGQQRLGGTVALAAAADGGSRFRVDLGGDVTALFLPAYRGFFGPDVTLQASGRREAAGGFDLERLQLSTAALQLAGAARLAADGLPTALRLDLRLAGVAGAPVRLPLAGDPVEVQAAELRLDFDAARGEGWRLDGTMHGLTAPTLRAAEVRLDGAGRIRRLGDSPALDGAMEWAARGLAPTDPGLAALLGNELTGQARFHWATAEPLSLPVLTASGDGLALDAALIVAGPAHDPVIAGRMGGRLADLGRLGQLAGRPLGGAGVVDWIGSLHPLSGLFDGIAHVVGHDLATGDATADALLRGDSLIRLAAARGAEGVQIRDLAVTARQLQLHGQGWLRSTGPDLRADFTLADLGVLGGDRGGRMQATARLRGTALDDDLRLDLRGSGHDLRLGIPLTDGLLQGETTLDLAAHLLGGTLRLDRLDLANAAWRAGASGTLAAATRAITARFDLPDLRRAGTAYHGSLAGTVTYALTDGHESAELQTRSRDLAIGVPMADRLLRGETTLRTSASRQDGAIRLDGLALTNPQLNAQGTATAVDGRHQLDLTGRLGDLAWLVPEIPGPVTLSGQVTERDGWLGLDLRAQGPGGIAAQLGGGLAADLGRADLTLKGSADSRLANAFLGPVALQGPLSVDLTMTGRPGLAALGGTLRLAGGHLTLADPPLAFDDVATTVTLGGGRATIAAGARARNGGRLAITGPVTLAPPFNGDLVVTIDGIRLRDPQLYQTSIAGRLTVAGPLTGGARIAGDITLAETELQIPSTGLGGTAAIPDLRHIGEPAAVRLTRARAGLLANGTEAGSHGSGRAAAFPLDITIRAPNRIFIRGRGLDAELGGSFRIGGTTAAVVPDGGLELIRGRLDLLGKRFTFSEGWLQLQGSMVPVLRLVATTATDDGTAGITLDGPADAPEIHFTATPELPEEEVIARLLFGRGLTSLTPLQAAQLASAVATLTGRGGMGVVDRLRQSFGLDDLDLTASADGTAAMRAGRYLSEKVYLDLELDSSGRSAVSINLDLTPSLTLRGSADADGGSGLGLYYERDY